MKPRLELAEPQSLSDRLKGLLEKMVTEAALGDIKTRAGETIKGPTFAEKLKLVDVATRFEIAQARMGADAAETDQSDFEREIEDVLSSRTTQRDARAKPEAAVEGDTDETATITDNGRPIDAHRVNGRADGADSRH